jgi:hypothetical protein
MTRAAVTGVWFLVFIAPVGLYGPQPLDCITAHALPRSCAVVVYIMRVAKSPRGISVRVDSTHFDSYMDDGSHAHVATHSYTRPTHAPTSPRTRTSLAHSSANVPSLQERGGLLESSVSLPRGHLLPRSHDI